MHFRSLSPLLFLFLIPHILFAQPVAQITIGWWNMENVFDCVDDPGSGDDEYLPQGKKQWTHEKLHRKLLTLSRVINDMNPDVLGFCEVEHESLIDSLLKYVPRKYGKVYYESSDRRGIDMGMIYDKSKFSLVDSKKHPIPTKGRPTREIIEISLSYLPLFYKGDGRGEVLHFLLNHWPSRLGGQLESEPRRLIAAAIARRIIDDILAKDSTARIIVLGDFNDEPFDRSISEVLRASGKITQVKTANDLFNSTIHFVQEKKGTHYYSGKWSVIDQIIISRSLLVSGSLVIADTSSIMLFKRDYMLSKSGQPLPFSRGGCSDHLPILLPLFVKERVWVRSSK